MNQLTDGEKAGIGVAIVALIAGAFLLPKKGRARARAFYGSAKARWQKRRFFRR